MSTLSEKNRGALFAKLNVSGVTNLATRGVHHMIAPEVSSGVPTAPPYVVFSRVPLKIDYALGGNIVGERDMWLIKAIVDKDSSTTLSPEALAEQILTACDTAIGGTLTLTGSINRMARRTSEIPPYKEILTDRIVWHFGFYLLVYTE